MAYIFPLAFRWRGYLILIDAKLGLIWGATGTIALACACKQSAQLTTMSFLAVRIAIRFIEPEDDNIAVNSCFLSRDDDTFVLY